MTDEKAIAIADRIFQPLQYDHAGAVGAHRAGGARAECAAMSIARADPALLEHVAVMLGDGT